MNGILLCACLAAKLHAPTPISLWPELKAENMENPHYQPKFTLKHLTKSGGTFLHALFKEIMPPSLLRYTSDDTALPVSTAKHKPRFVAVTMRNVCDVYLSFASFNPGKAYAFGTNQTVGRYPFQSNNYQKLLSPTAFKEWLLNARRKHTKSGFYSFYFHGNVVNPDCYYHNVHTKPFYAPNPNEAELTIACDLSLTRIPDDLRTFDPTRVARCWLFHETMMEDVKRCLMVWELESRRSVVNWEKFEAIAKNKTMQATILGSQARVKMKGRNTQTHVSCTEMFPRGGELEQIVRETDPWLFEKLGYSGCCTHSNHLSVYTEI